MTKKLLYSKITSGDNKTLRQELLAKTILKGKELDFVIDLSLLGKKEGIEFYLTGSATERGAVSTFIINKIGGSYRDIDLIAVVKKDYVSTGNKVEELIRKQYGFFVEKNV